MIFQIGGYTTGGTQAIAVRCPGCGRQAVFEPLGNVADVARTHPQPQLWLGQRRCPSPSCHTHVFVVFDTQLKVHRSYPVQRIDFDASKIPAPVLKAFDEALTCHANECYIAGAMLVRKTLEELCDERGAKGGNLKDRLKDLKSKVILPPALFDALDELRLLGNDAAHIETKSYNDVSEPEVRAGIAVAKEILKSVYQLDALVGQLKALKKP